MIRQHEVTGSSKKKKSIYIYTVLFDHFPPFFYISLYTHTHTHKNESKK